MPSFTLYGSLGSTCTDRVRLALAEGGFTDYEFVLLTLPKGDQKSEEHMKRHPWGKVPAITLPDGFTVYESRAICSFLAKNYSLQLLPLESDLKAMALFEQAQSVEIFYFAEPAGRIIFEKHVKPIKGLLADEVVILEALRMLEQFFNIAERLLQSQCYMAGNDFTLVDIYYIPLILRLFSYDFGSLVTNRKTVSDWWDRCITRPGIKEILDADKKAAAVHGK